MAKELNDQIGLININKKDKGSVVCLGMTFENDEARKAYFTEELRKKLPELKKIDGFPIGEDEDILALSDPPYYTACPNPFIPDFIKQWEIKKKEMYEEEEEEYHREPFAADVSEGKNDPVYNAHSYHTKVPHKAIMKYIMHYTKPGDIVFDGFCGSGMTGVAAQMCSKGNNSSESYLEIENSENWGYRNVILSDLSPIATFISSNYNKNITDKAKVEKKVLQIIDDVEKECGWMYETTHVNDDMIQMNMGENIIGKVNYIIWSDVLGCPECGREYVFWDLGIDKKERKVKDEYFCLHCSALISKKDSSKVMETTYDNIINETVSHPKQQPVIINYSVGKKRYDKRPDEKDLSLIRKINDMKIPYWVASYKLPNGYNTMQPIRSHNFLHSHDFYTKRNLYVLASIFHRIMNLGDNYILYLFTAIRMLSSKNTKVQINKYFQNGQFFSYVTGTLYVPSINIEGNVINSFKNRMKTGLVQYGVYYRDNSHVISTQSSGNMFNIHDNSIDYIFIDPPFGNNLMYSELNFLWESWLKVFTNNRDEAIVNNVQEKGLPEYQTLILQCFRQFNRILKPGRWLTVEFSNSQASVWNSIQESIQRAGFVISNVSALDKQQGSFKAVTTTVAVKQDLVISAYKPTDEMKTAIINTQNTEQSAWIFVRNHLEQLPVFIGEKGAADLIVERTPRVLFDRMIAYHVQNGYSVPISSAEFQAGVVQRFPMRDNMVFLENQVAEYDKKRILAKEFVQISLFVSDENSAIEWIRQQLYKKPQTRQELHPGYMKEIQHISKYEKLPELDILLEQNFLQYDGTGPVPGQIHGYLSTNFKDLRELDKEDLCLRVKAKERWYVPDPNKQADLEKLREKSLMREFAVYVDEINRTKKKLKQFRLEAIRAGFKKAWGDKDYKTIVDVGSKIPENVLQEDDKLLMYFDNAQIRLDID